MILGLVISSSTSLADARPGTYVPPEDHAWVTEHPVIQKLLDLTNTHRAKYNRAPVELDPYLTLKAQEHAEWMAKTGYYQHSRFGYPEIIFYSPGSAQNAINGWIRSPAHHGIMLKRANYVGFGYMMINGRDYWVGIFY
jgi:uncharacterized protein YkwD